MLLHSPALGVGCWQVGSQEHKSIGKSALRMARLANHRIEKVFKMAAKGVELHAAWLRCGSPTTWGNVLRKWNERLGWRCNNHASSQLYARVHRRRTP
jgi:hypothetical protein